jgi:hypothetical protein
MSASPTCPSLAAASGSEPRNEHSGKRQQAIATGSAQLDATYRRVATVISRLQGRLYLARHIHPSIIASMNIPVNVVFRVVVYSRRNRAQAMLVLGHTEKFGFPIGRRLVPGWGFLPIIGRP